MQDPEKRHPGVLNHEPAAASAALAAGELVALPTETTYGLAADATRPEVVARLRRAVGLADDAPITLNRASAADAAGLLTTHPAQVQRSAVRLLPQPVTLRVALDDAQRPHVLQALGLGEAQASAVTDGRAMSLRVPAPAVTRELLASHPGPVVVAGLRTKPGRPAITATQAADAAPDAAVVLDGGRSRFGRPSTLADVSDGTLVIARQGVLDERYLSILMRRTVLFVCTGNTCRSPMAAGIARQLLAEARGVAVDELDAAGLRVVSAGVFAGPGAPASAEAVQVLEGRGIDLSGHQSRGLAAELVNDAEVIWTMTESHRDVVIQAAPQAAGKTHRLDAAVDIADPIGGPIEAYAAAADQITAAIRGRMQEFEP